MASSLTDVSCCSVRDLRRRWKPHKERLSAVYDSHPTCIRFHRACSWLDRVERMGNPTDYDLALVSQWIAFNALYGQWDVELREPAPDRKCWREFLSRCLELDQGDYLPGTLQHHKRLVESLLDDQYLSDFFWEEPGDQRARQSKSAKYRSRTWYIEHNWTLILDEVMERIYLMRCQLVHGAATYGGKLNRVSLRRCSTMLGHLLPALLLVLIEYGADEDWGPMCYPPLASGEREERWRSGKPR